MDEVTTLITTVGFPIAMCLLLYFQSLKTSEQHKAEIDELKQAIENNTLVVQQLVQSLSHKD